MSSTKIKDHKFYFSYEDEKRVRESRDSKNKNYETLWGRFFNTTKIGTAF